MNVCNDPPMGRRDPEGGREAERGGAPHEDPNCILYHVQHPISGKHAYVVGPTVDSVVRVCSLLFRALEGDALSITELAGGPGQPQLLIHESAVPPRSATGRS